MKVLANDGISQSGIDALHKGGFEVITTKVAQEQVANFINSNDVAVLLVRSATKVRKDIIDACPGLKIIGRGGVGMDNIDVEYARANGKHVINTPASSSESVAELVFAHLFTGVRFLQDSNRNMPLEGDSNFDGLKKAYANGIELRGKTLGIIGFGRIGQAVAKMALGLGMKVIAADKFVDKAEVKVDFYNGQFINVEFETEPLEVVIKHTDFKHFDMAYCITCHVSQGSTYDFPYSIYEYKYFCKKLLYTAMSRSTKKSNINFIDIYLNSEVGYIYIITVKKTIYYTYSRLFIF